jgi:hypothetical protein
LASFAKFLQASLKFDKAVKLDRLVVLSFAVVNAAGGRTMAEQVAAPRAKFARMDESTQSDWLAIAGSMMPFASALPDRVLAHLSQLKGDHGGFAVDRFEHCLQTATLAA